MIKIDSFGFRGEALSSLCALSKVTVITSTQEEAPSGNKLEYNFNGQLIKITPVAREVIIIYAIFSFLFYFSLFIKKKIVFFF